MNHHGHVHEQLVIDELIAFTDVWHIVDPHATAPPLVVRNQNLLVQRFLTINHAHDCSHDLLDVVIQLISCDGRVPLRNVHQDSSVLHKGLRFVAALQMNRILYFLDPLLAGASLFIPSANNFG